MKLSISKSNASVDQLMADIEHLCHELPASNVPWNVRNVMDPLFTTPVNPAPLPRDIFNAIDVIDVIKTHGMSDTLISLFNDEMSLESIIVRNDDGTYDNDAICKNLAQTIFGDDIETDTEAIVEFLLGGIFLALAGLNAYFNSFTKRATRIIALMKECYTEVLSKGEANVQGLMSTEIIAPPKAIWKKAVKDRIALGTQIIAVLENGNFTDLDRTPINAILERLGRSYNAKDDELRKTDKQPKRQEATLKDLGFSFNDFVDIYRAEMEALVTALDITKRIKQLVEQLKTETKQLKKKNVSDVDHTTQKAALKQNGMFLHTVITYYCNTMYSSAIGVYGIAEMAYVAG